MAGGTFRWPRAPAPIRATLYDWKWYTGLGINYEKISITRKARSQELVEKAETVRTLRVVRRVRGSAEAPGCRKTRLDCILA